VANRWKCTERADGTILAGNVLVERDGQDYSGKTRICDAAAHALVDDGQWNAGHLYGRLRLLRCIECGGLFVGDHAASLCSDDCLRKHRASKRPHRPSRITRTVRRQQEREGLTCVVCGTPIAAQRSNRKCCSDRCRQRWHRQTPTLPAEIQPGGV
jgi:predicted nucleic acid-binding Zn ribbon protein